MFIDAETLCWLVCILGMEIYHTIQNQHYSRLLLFSKRDRPFFNYHNCLTYKNLQNTKICYQFTIWFETFITASFWETGPIQYFKFML